MLSKNVNNFYDIYYRQVNRLLLLVGLWPYQDKRDKFVRTLIANFVLIVAFILLVYQMCLPTFKIESNFKEIQVFLLFLCVMVSYYSMAFKQEAGRRIRDRINADWTNFSCEEEEAILTKYAKENERYTILLTLILYLFGISLIAPSLLKIFLHAFHVKNDTELTLPIPMKSISYIDEHFYVALSIELFGLWYVITISIVVFTSFLSCIKHSCAVLRVITFKIYQPFIKVSDDLSYDWFNTKNRNAYDWIKEIAKCYKDATEYIDLLNSISEKVYLVEIFTATLIVVINFLYLYDSLQLYNMDESKSFEKMYEVFMCSVYMACSVMTIYINCHLGQTLMDHGTGVLDSFYQVSLYELPLKCQRALPFMILRSSKPCVISIGGMFTASHDFFARFMNTSVSYMMVCYNMR